MTDDGRAALTRPSDPLRVCVAVSTRNRPRELARLIRELSNEFRGIAETGSGRFRTRLIVIDNDPSGSARAVVDSSDAGFIDYFIETHPGVTAPRNRALTESANQDVLVFIDDDEIPSTGWLKHLLEVYISYSADAVAGPVCSIFEDDVHPFVAAGGFFDRAHRHHLRTGTVIDRAATNNLLVDLRTVRRLGLTFDDRFGRSGGEDSLFTGSLAGAGGRIVWCADALVYDPVHPSRNVRKYVLKRAFNMSNNTCLVELALAPDHRLSVRLRMMSAGAASVLLGLARAVWGVASSDLNHRARGERAIAQGVGKLAGLVGYRYHPYGGG